MSKDCSFDVVSEVDMQEVDNAVNQAKKEIGTRYDFRGSKAEISLDGDTIKIIGDDEYKLNAIIDVLKGKMVKRNVAIKNLDYGKVEPAAGATVRQIITIKKGITKENAKEVVKAIKNMKLKVQASIQEDQVRVSGKDKDDLLGFIHIRDLYNQKLLEDKVDLTKILRKITYVSESELTSRVLEKLRKDRVQMAIVVDEYGGTSGIVTVEDILEEIVGEIQDEFDEDEELDIKKLDKDSYIVQGTATITEINKVLNIEIEKDGFDSIGGWMFFMLGMDIEINQSVDFSGYRFKVVEIDKFRVISIKIERIK